MEIMPNIIPGIPPWGQGASWEKLVTSPNGNKYWIPKDATDTQMKDIEEVMKIEEGLYQVKSAEECRQFYAPGDHTLILDANGKHGQGGWGIYRDVDAMIAGYQAQQNEVMELNIAMDETHIQVGGDMASVVWLQTLKSKKSSDGSEWKWTYRQTDVHRKINGKWMIVQTQVSIPFYGGDMADMMQPQYFPESK